MAMGGSAVKALTFDFFGTVTDWYSSVLRDGKELSDTTGVDVDWGEFAIAWRRGYWSGMEKVLRGELPWTNIDRMHRMALEELLHRFDVTGLTEAQKDDFNRVWHRLMPWPDAKSGLARLRNRYVVAILSNGNLSLLVDSSKYAGLLWDCVLSAELANSYKPDPKVYETAASLLGLSPSDVMMVAAHKSDLLAAGRVGFKMAFVSRPMEFGGRQLKDETPDPLYDLVAGDFNELADRLGA